MGVGRDSDACRLFILNWTENNSIIILRKFYNYFEKMMSCVFDYVPFIPISLLTTSLYPFEPIVDVPIANKCDKTAIWDEKHIKGKLIFNKFSRHKRDKVLYGSRGHIQLRSRKNSIIILRK